MRLNRSLIKVQAKQLIKGKVWKLFLAAFVISLCLSSVSGIFSGILGIYGTATGIEENGYEDYFDKYFDGQNPFSDKSKDYDSDYFNDFGDGESNDFFDFTGRIAPVAFNAKATSTYNALSSLLDSLSTIATIALAPLGITLSIFFVWFIRGNEYETGKGIEIIFKESFNKNYFKKVLCFFIRNALTTVLGFLFIIPGIVFYYSSYYAFELLCDYPELSSWEAIKLSKKMIRGHRGELFALDLSFIGWALLCIFIFPAIYYIPYEKTTKALFYENFRLRALQTGELTEDDFLSEQQRFAKYASGAGMGMPMQGAPQQNVNPYSATNAQQFGMGAGVSANPFGVQNQTAGSYRQSGPYVPPQGGFYMPPAMNMPPRAPIYPPASQPQAAPVVAPFVPPQVTPQAAPIVPQQPVMPQKPQMPTGGYYQPPIGKTQVLSTAPPPNLTQSPIPIENEDYPPGIVLSGPIEPEEPQEPTYAEVILPEEPVDAFTEVLSPTEPEDDNPLSGNTTKLN